MFAPVFIAIILGIWERFSRVLTWLFQYPKVQ